MKVILAAFLVGLAVVVSCAELYSDKYDNLDVDEILSNQRLYQKYYDCIIGKGKCSPDALELKEYIPEALQNDCAKCTAKQKEGSEKVLRFLITEKKDDYKVLEEKFDPEGIYRKKYEHRRILIENGKGAIAHIFNAAPVES